MDTNMNDVPFVSVVIPVRNDGDHLAKCLTALYKQTYPDSRYEVMVMDNNSTKDIYSVCQPFPNVRYCQETKPGNNAARNQGIAEARGDIIAITDADCIPHPDWLAAGVRSLQSHPQAGIMGGHIQFFFQGKHPTVVEYADSIANHQLCALTGQKPPSCSFLPMEWQFFRTVLGDANLLRWREKLAFVWVMHRLKWAIAWEPVYCPPVSQRRSASLP